jgi:hypothetical protein
MPDLPVAALVDLDACSAGWGVVHAADVAVLGGSPEDAYDVDVDATPPEYPGVPSQAGTSFDLEDVVFPSVLRALEVVSGDVLLDPSTFALERYDERWNARPDATTTGIDRLHSATTHTEVVLPPPSGATLALVGDWLVDVLSE